MYKFVLNETSYHGTGSISAVPEEVKARGFKKVFTVTDPDEGKIVGDDETFEQEHVTSVSGGGCGGSASGPIGLASVAFRACFAIFRRKRNA